jgi:nitric oxide reductase subunit C
MHKRFVFGLALAAALALAACGGGGSSGGADPARGEALFKQSTIGTASAPGCSTCHSLQAGQTLVGPSQADVATRADNILKSGKYTGTAKTVEDFLRESIVNPDAYVEEGFQPGVMYPNFGKELSEQEINDLVAYLATLK